MEKVSTYKQAGVELGNIVALTEMINKYLAKDKKIKTTAKVVKQSDKELTKVLKTKYILSADEVSQILSMVDGKKIVRKKAKATKEVDNTDYAALKRDIDTMVNTLEITIRDKSLSEQNYLKKVKANLSVRKGKLVNQLHSGREKKAKK